MINKKMKRKTKNGFTLVELLAVIAVLGLILIIAIPKVMDVLNTQKKRTLELTTKSIIKAAEEKYIENSAYGIDEEITCEGVSNITSSDFDTCTIKFDKKGNAKVTIIGKGRYEGFNVCSGTKTNSTAIKEECPTYKTVVEHIQKLLLQEETLNNGLVQTTAEYEGITYDAGIRYSGAIEEVKNKVYYNCEDTDANGIEYGEDDYDYTSSCEVWRIIGVFDTKTSIDGPEVKRAKIINIESTFSSSWDSSAYEIYHGLGINQWGPSGNYKGADLMQLLNGYYIGKQDSICRYCNDIGQKTCENICDTSENTLASQNMKPITNSAKSIIENVVWDTYAIIYPDDGLTGLNWVSTAYLEEKGISAQNNGKNLCVEAYGNDFFYCNDNVERITSWTGLVGLMSVSDITYANGWLYDSKIYPWSISSVAYSEFSNTVWASDSRDLNIYEVGTSGGVWPSVYLKSGVKIIGGNGDDKPYILSN